MTPMAYFVQTHNGDLKKIKTLFNILDFGYREYQLEGKVELIVTEERKADEERVSRNLEMVEMSIKG